MAIGGIDKVSVFQRADHDGESRYDPSHDASSSLITENTDWVHKQNLSHPSGGVDGALHVELTSLSWLNATGDLAASYQNHGVVYVI